MKIMQDYWNSVIDRKKIKQNIKGIFRIQFLHNKKKHEIYIFLDQT